MFSLTLIVPALNEEGNLQPTVLSIQPILEKYFSDYEILIFNDASQDQTGKIADELVSRNSKIKVIHNSQTMGLGYNYKRGVELAKKEYISMIPGDNEITVESFEIMFKKLGETDMIIPYTVNPEVRSISRQLLSQGFTFLINKISGLNLKYYNGPVAYRRDLIQSIEIETNSFAYQSEALIQLLKAGHTYLETPMYIKAKEFGTTKAFHISNITRVLQSIIKIFYAVHIQKKYG